VQVSEKLLSGIMSSTDGSASAIANKLNEYQGIKQEIYRLKCEEEKLRKDYEGKKNSLKEDFKIIRKQCDHPTAETGYHADPAGGSDSFHSCGICGHEW
jgi:hypothetical protein